MSAIEKAARDAVEAADNTELTRQIAAILAAQQLLNQQQPAQPAAPVQPFDAKKWVVIGGVVVSVGLVGALFAAALALVAVAVAVGGTCATVCLLILSSLYRDYLKEK